MYVCMSIQYTTYMHANLHVYMNVLCRYLCVLCNYVYICLCTYVFI
jgi:hypothetical protein